MEHIFLWTCCSFLLLVMEVFVSYPQGDDESGKSKTEIRKLRENHCILYLFCIGREGVINGATKSVEVHVRLSSTIIMFSSRLPDVERGY